MATKERANRERNTGIIHARVGEELRAMADELAASKSLDITNWLRVMIQAEHAKLRRRKKDD